MEYQTTLYDVIHNKNGYTYYKLIIDGVSHYDEFVDSLKKLPNEQRSLKKVLTLMEKFSPTVQLMENRFRQIKGLKRNDVYEFKDPPCVRIYIVLQKPNIFIVDGSTKKKQNAAIDRIGRLLKEFKIEGD